MPRVYRKKKEVERILIRQFVDHLGYRILKPNWRDSPDAILTLAKGNRRIRVAIEHTDYHLDAQAGTSSQVADLNEFWKAVQTSIARRVARRPRVRSVSVTVRFSKSPDRPRKHIVGLELAQKFARELVSFVSKNIPSPGNHKDIRNTKAQPSAFSEYPLLLSLVDWISIYSNSQTPWRCDNVHTGSIGIKLSFIEKAIANKTKKAKNYTWEDAQEKWLLIAAAGQTVANRAGPPNQNVQWETVTTSSSCQESPFDRIFFWEAVRGWHKELKKPDTRKREP